METIRLINSCDYDQIIIHLNEWWGGRKMTDMLPRLFFNHFKNTCYIIESNDKIKGFIIGFISQVDSTLGYVHFIGVNPEFRKEGLGKILYFTLFRRFYDLGVKENIFFFPLNYVSMSYFEESILAYITINIHTFL